MSKLVEAFVVMIFGLPAFFFQILGKQEKKQFWSDLFQAMFIATAIVALAWLVSPLTYLFDILFSL